MKIAALLLGVFLVLGCGLIVSTAPTTDEIPFHMPNGYAYWKTRDYRMSPANPPLLREWMTIPWFAIGPKLNLDKNSWREAESVPFGVEFFYGDNRAIADRLLYSSRFMILILGLFLGALIWRWAGELYGPRAGLLALFLYVFSPVFTGYSSIAHTDIGVAMFTALAGYGLWRRLEGGQKKDLWLFAFAFGAACAAKFNALAFGPFFIAAACARKGPREAMKLAAAAAFAGFWIIWAAYLFEWKPVLAGGVPRVEEKLGYVAAIAERLSAGNGALREFLRKAALELPLPAPSYLLGLSGIVRSHQEPYLHYAMGRWTTETQWYVYALSFALKMTLPFLALLAVRIARADKNPAHARHAEWVLLLPSAAYFLMTFGDSTAVGIRYLLPVLPFILIWISGIVQRTPSKGWKPAFTLLLIWQAAGSILAYPSHLAYFNEGARLLGGGHRFVRGSDADWGQGLKALSRYVKRARIDEISLEYFGTADPAFYGIPYRNLTPAERAVPEARVYAVSVYYLEHCAWTAGRKPSAVVDGSIFVYDFRRGAPA